MRVLATISRTWPRWDIAIAALSAVAAEHPGERVTLVHGDNPNGDRNLARIARSLYGWDLEAHPAQWRKNGIYNPRAGLLRNQEMVDRGATVCLAFIHNGSRGASHCADRAEAAGIETRRHYA